MIVGYLLGGSISNAAKVVDDRVIFLHEEKLGHFDAQDKCESPSNATQLLKVDTKEIHKWIKEQNDVMWVDGLVQNDLTWADGSSMNGFAAHNLPEEQGQFCVSANDIGGRLTVKDCSLQQAYACQTNFDVDGFDVETAPGRAIKYFKDKLTRDEAADYCKKNLPRPGYLLTVDNAEINDWVVNKKKKMWIGLNDKEEEHVFVWDSGVPFEYDNWMSTGPVDAGCKDASGQIPKEDVTAENCNPTEQCVNANLQENGNYVWNDIPCSESFTFACEIWL